MNKLGRAIIDFFETILLLIVTIAYVLSMVIVLSVCLESEIPPLVYLLIGIPLYIFISTVVIALIIRFSY